MEWLEKAIVLSLLHARYKAKTGISPHFIVAINRSLLNNSCSDKIERSRERQLQLRDTVKVRRFSEQEKSAFEVDTKEAFEEFWNNTLSAKRHFDARYDQGAGKAIGKATRFASSGSDLLSNIRPILDIVNGVGAPFAGTAIGTIAFVFVVRQPSVPKSLKR